MSWMLTLPLSVSSIWEKNLWSQVPSCPLSNGLELELGLGLSSADPDTDPDTADTVDEEVEPKEGGEEVDAEGGSEP
jgi:hypothetical protein